MGDARDKVNNGRRNNSKNHSSTVERVVVALTALALNCPSTFTIAWSKEEHPEELPVLYAGIGSSLLTVLGAVLDNDWIMYGGLLSSMSLFGYVVFFYQSPNHTLVTQAEAKII